MNTESKALLSLVAIDDDPDSLALIKGALKQQQLEVVTATDPCAGLELVRSRRPAVVLLDLMMPKMNGMEVLERILQGAPETDVVLITGYYSTDSAVEAIRRGACDYLTKPLSVSVLRERIGKLIDEAQRRRQAVELDGELLRTHQFEGIVGRSPLMLQVFERIRRVAPHFRTVLVTGATGTGKELVATALHRLSPASKGRLSVCNCSAVVETLFESELFGHVKGAFTGAVQDKAGVFEYANGGTVFLDEIGDLPLETQSKLLRVLENGEIQRVGSPVSRRVDVRVVSATNRNLQELMTKRQFREDLYYRLSMVEIQLPRLADRKEDLPLLERHFIEQFAAQYNKVIRGITPRAQIVLASHSWPGNVRELKSVLGSACMMAEGETIDVRDLPENVRARVWQGAAEYDGPLTLAEMERRYILRVLESVGGNKAQAAKILGIHRATIYRLLGEAEPARASQGQAE
jgi:DNA-binding NtrC family response regulator